MCICLAAAVDLLESLEPFSQTDAFAEFSQ